MTRNTKLNLIFFGTVITAIAVIISPAFILKYQTNKSRASGSCYETIIMLYKQDPSVRLDIRIALKDQFLSTKECMDILTKVDDRNTKKRQAEEDQIIRTVVGAS